MGGHNALSFALGGIQGSLDAPWTASEKKRHRPLQSGFRQAERKAHLRRSEPPAPPPHSRHPTPYTTPSLDGTAQRISYGIYHFFRDGIARHGFVA